MRRLALAVALGCAQTALAGEPGLKLQRTPAGPRSGGGTPLPVFLSADRIEGITGKESVAEGSAELHKGTTAVYADWLKYIEATEDVQARGRVRLERDGDVISGPSLKYRVNDATGIFEQPEFMLAPRKRQSMQPITGRGRARTARFEGEDKYRLFDAFFTTCKPGNRDWYMAVGELDLDYTRDVGTARNATIYFKDVPIMKVPYLDFALNNQRKSGFLLPLIGSSGKNGPEITLPYYFNLAPNRDLTVSPRVMQKRGVQLGADLRFLERHFYGEAKAEVLPHDMVVQQRRSAVSLVANYDRPGLMNGALNLNRVSDDNYFRDLSSRLAIATQTTLPREGYLSYYGGWWNGGWWNATGRIQAFQVLQDASRSIPMPYWRVPQLALNVGKQDAGFGVDFNFTGEVVNFRHPTNVTGLRSTVYPSLSLPIITAGSFLTPKIGLHSTHYALDPNGNVPAVIPGTAQLTATSGTLSRTLPIFSVDGGLIYERDARWQGQGLIQTLEPRAYYLLVPHRDQSRIPVFDTALADFNYAQIFSENSFVGGDRVNDANQLTLAVTSRLLYASTGQEAARATVGQRYYFADQQVILDPTATRRTFNSSNWLAALSGRLTQRWTAETAFEYNARESRAERVSVGVRYQPELLKTLNMSYRYLRGQLRQIDVSGQWPLGRGWYGVGRLNYSLMDGRIVEGLAGFEYNGDCWIGRVVLQRFAVAAGSAAPVVAGSTLPVVAGSSTNAIFLQIELNGFSRIGSNPIEALKRSIPGYARINQAVPVGRPYNFDD
jgi:LPS-assembly protein